MVNKIFSPFIFLRLYYLFLTPEKVLEKLEKNMRKKFLRKGGIFGVKRSLDRRFFTVTITGYDQDTFEIYFSKQKKKIHVCIVDDDRGPTGVECIQLLDLNRKKFHQVVKEVKNSQWVW